MKSSGGLTLWIVSIALAAQTGCAPKVVRPPLPSVQLKSQMGAVGIVGARYGPDTDFSRPIPSKPLAALAGMGGGLAVGIGSGAVCYGTLGIAWPFCGIAIWTPGMMVTGIVEGVDKGVTIAEIKAGTEALRVATPDGEVQDTLRDVVVQTALHQAAGRTVVPVPQAGPRGPKEPLTYTYLASERLDTVLEVGVLRVQLRRAAVSGWRGTYGPSLSFEDWMNPTLELAVEARVRLVRVNDGSVLFSRRYDYSSGRNTFMEWTRDGAQAFRDARDTALQHLGAEIAVDFLGPFLTSEPTRVEPATEYPDAEPK
jgi:hypothetical protein